MEENNLQIELYYGERHRRFVENVSDNGHPTQGQWKNVNTTEWSLSQNDLC